MRLKSDRRLQGQQDSALEFHPAREIRPISGLNTRDRADNRALLWRASNRGGGSWKNRYVDLRPADNIPSAALRIRAFGNLTESCPVRCSKIDANVVFVPKLRMEQIVPHSGITL